MSSGIVDIDYALPDLVETNAELARDFPETDLKQLEQRTGVASRHVAAPHQTALDLADAACRKLIAKGALIPAGVDALLFCTQTPDHVMPPNACLLQSRLGLPTSIMAFDITLACSGYVYALQIARGLIACGSARTVLVVTGDTYSRLVDRSDRSTRALFGDGATASVLQADAPTGNIQDVICATDGSQGRRFWIPAGGVREPMPGLPLQSSVAGGRTKPAPDKIHMDGMGVLSFFAATVPRLVSDLLVRNSLAIDDIDLFIFHQASRLTLEALQKKMKISSDRFVIDMNDVGNLVSSSLPVALKRAQAAGRVKAGARVLLCGFGVGLSWGAALLQY